MYYDERLRSPISEYNVKRTYGVDPTKDPERAKRIGVYPLQEGPEGYPALRYEKVDNHYRTVPYIISNENLTDIGKVKPIVNLLKTLLTDWAAQTGYNEGDYVIHNGEVWLAVSSNFDNSPDDNDPLDWERVDI